MTSDEVKAIATAIAKANQSPDSDETTDISKFVNLVVLHFEADQAGGTVLFAPVLTAESPALQAHPMDTANSNINVINPPPSSMVASAPPVPPVDHP